MHVSCDGGESSSTQTSSYNSSGMLGAGLWHDADGMTARATAALLLPQEGLSKRVHLFLSDVETNTWSAQDLNRVVSAAAQVVVTEGEKGATLLVAQDSRSGGASHRALSSSSGGKFTERKIPPVKVGYD
jgi:hypothetical protein